MATAVPLRTARRNCDDDEMVVVAWAVSGRLRKATDAPTVSARAMIAPPCMTSPLVQRSGDHASVPTTSSGPIDTSSAPISAMKGMALRAKSVSFGSATCSGMGPPGGRGGAGQVTAARG